jgi:hypothetical protein
MGRTDGATFSEIGSYILSVLADRSKVEGISSRIQGKYHVKLLDQDRARLVNSTDDGLTSLAQLPEKAHDRVCGLGVET